MRPTRLASCYILLVDASHATAAAQAADPGLPRLERELARLAPIAEGTVGLAAIHIETGRTVVLNRGTRFPMASVRKVPIALTLLALVDEGKERLDRAIVLKPTDLRPGSGTLTELFDDPGVSLPLHNLLELMLLVSDNTDQRKKAQAAFEIDPRDTTTPEAMVGLLRAIWDGKTLSPTSRDLLLDIMRRCQTGTTRLKGLLPPGTVVAHKTGSIAQSVSDVGIVYLPDGAGHVVTVAYVKDSPGETAERERALAQAARAVYDFFLFTPGGASTASAAR